MKFFEKSLTTFLLLRHAVLRAPVIACLILIIASFCVFLNGTAAGENEMLALTSFAPGIPAGDIRSYIDKTEDIATINPENVAPEASNLILQSKDGGQTWEDISYSLPENEKPEDFFAGDSEIYLRANDILYSSKANLKAPVWEKENSLEHASIAFNRSGVIAYNYEGQIYQKAQAGTWLPVYTNFKKQLMHSIFETSDGTLLVACENGLYRSTDRGQHWKQVLNQGWVMKVVESEGVLIGTSQNGIMRSTDHGEHWESVINEGGVGIAVERIDGGFAAISYNTKTLSRKIHISLDGGITWTAIDEGLPSSLLISSIQQAGPYLLCGHPDGIFRSADRGKTWSMVHPGVNSQFAIFGKTWNNGKVFTLYASGNVLYAVAKNTGC